MHHTKIKQVDSSKKHNKNQNHMPKPNQIINQLKSKKSRTNTNKKKTKFKTIPKPSNEKQKSASKLKPPEFKTHTRRKKPKAHSITHNPKTQKLKIKN